MFEVQQIQVSKINQLKNTCQIIFALLYMQCNVMIALPNVNPQYMIWMQGGNYYECR